MKANVMYLNLGLHRGFEAQGSSFDPQVFCEHSANLSGNSRIIPKGVEIFGYPVSRNDVTYLQFELCDYLNMYNCSLIKTVSGVKIIKHD